MNRATSKRAWQLANKACSDSSTKFSMDHRRTENLFVSRKDAAERMRLQSARREQPLEGRPGRRSLGRVFPALSRSRHQNRNWEALGHSRDPLACSDKFHRSLSSRFAYFLSASCNASNIDEALNDCTQGGQSSAPVTCLSDALWLPRRAARNGLAPTTAHHLHPPRSFHFPFHSSPKS